MKKQNRPKGFRRIALAMFVLVMFGAIGIPAGSAGAGIAMIQHPSVGEIAVDSYNCETGELAFHVPVADLFAVDPNVTNFSDYPLVYAFGAHYGSEPGPQVSAGVFVWTPTPEQSPLTGTVHLEGFVPPTHDGEAIARIVLVVAVGTGDTLDDPTDSDVETYLTDCDAPDDLVSQLIAKLKEVLFDILNA